MTKIKTAILALLFKGFGFLVKIKINIETNAPETTQIQCDSIDPSEQLSQS